MSLPGRVLLVALLGVLALTLASCGSSGKQLIPARDAGPLRGDFKAVKSAALAGDGNCSATAGLIRKTERDFKALPLSVDPGLRAKLAEGIANLHSEALLLCAEQLPAATTTTSMTHSPSTSTTTTTKTTTSLTPASETSTSTSSSSTTSELPPGGGAQAPGAGGEAGTGTNPVSPEAEAHKGEAPGTGGTGQGGVGQGVGQGGEQ